jgi:tetratricopeptide (TPR) repeat protein
MYPELIKFTEDHLRALSPDSIALRVDTPALRLSQLDRDEAQTILSSLNGWSKEMEEKNAALSKTRHRDELSHQPPIRSAAKDHIITTKATPSDKPAPAVQANQTKTQKRIPGHDFRAWDKFDADAAMNEVDEPATESPKVASATNDSVHTRPNRSLPPPTVSRIPKLLKEREDLARAEKDKGNESQNAGDYEEAVVYYSRSLSVLETVAALNNRALAYLRLKQYAQCEADCSKVLGSEPANVKALIRRATARLSLKKLQDCRQDLDAVFKLEPQNKDALLVQKDLDKAAGTHTEKTPQAPAPATQTTAAPASAQPVKSRRLIIEEVSDDEDENEEEAEKTAAQPKKPEISEIQPQANPSAPPAKPEPQQQATQPAQTPVQQPQPVNGEPSKVSGAILMSHTIVSHY